MDDKKKKLPKDEIYWENMRTDLSTFCDSKGWFKRELGCSKQKFNTARASETQQEIKEHSPFIQDNLDLSLALAKRELYVMGKNVSLCQEME